MKIEIKSMDDRGVRTQVFVDGVEIGAKASEFTLSQKAGELPVLTVKYLATDSISAEITDSAVKEKPYIFS